MEATKETGNDPAGAQSSLERRVRPLFEADVLRVSSAENISRDNDGKYVDDNIAAMWAGYALASAVDWKSVRSNVD